MIVYATCKRIGHYLGLLLLDEDQVVEDKGIENDDGTFELRYKDDEKRERITYYLAKMHRFGSQEI